MANFCCILAALFSSALFTYSLTTVYKMKCTISSCKISSWYGKWLMICLELVEYICWKSRLSKMAQSCEKIWHFVWRCVFGFMATYKLKLFSFKIITIYLKELCLQECVLLLAIFAAGKWALILVFLVWKEIKLRNEVLKKV